MSDGTYTVLPETSDAAFAYSTDQISELCKLFCDSEGRKKKSKKKKKKKKKKKWDEALDHLLKDSKKSKGKKGKKKSKSKKAQKKAKHGNKKSKKAWKKKAKQDFQFRLIEKSTDKALDTASDIAKMYAESKFFSDRRVSKNN